MRSVVIVVVALLGVIVATAGPSAGETQVERGRYLVEVLAACGNCHSPKAPGGEAPGKHLAGGFEIDMPEAFGVAIASNITPDRETGIGAWTDAEIVRAIREGKSRDGRTLGPPMPFEFYRRLSDRDVTAMVAYLRTVAPVRNAVAPSRYTVPLPASYGPPLTSVPHPAESDRVVYGAYLVGPVAHCIECHTPKDTRGALDWRRLNAGGFRFTGPWGTVHAANITPDRETGIGAWTDAQIVQAIYGMNPKGRVLMPPMPWSYYAGKIAPRDLEAIVAYLRSVGSVRNVVPPPQPAAAPASPASR